MLEKGSNYQSDYSRDIENALNQIKKQVKQELTNQNENELLYVETPYGSIGINDLTTETDVSDIDNNVRDLLDEYRQYMKKG